MSWDQPKEFLRALKKGDLVLASNHGSGKVHLIHLVASKHELEKDTPEYQESEYRQDPGLTLWSGSALCGLSRRYYSRPVTDPGNGSWRCNTCFARWRAQGQPAVLGWTQAFNMGEVPVGDWPLPFGWQEADAYIKHPLDVGPDGDPASILDGEGKAQGVRRTELRRWQRGDLVVRVAQYHGEEGRGHAALYHDAREPLKEEVDKFGSLNECLQLAWTLMAKGGTP